MKTLILIFTLLGPLALASNQPVPKLSFCTNQEFFQNLVQYKKEIKKGSVNTFSKTGHGDFWFWHEEKMLLNPGLPAESLTCKTPYMLINRELTLKDGILPPGREPNGSSYLIMHEDAKDMIYDAVMKGVMVRVTKH